MIIGEVDFTEEGCYAALNMALFYVAMNANDSIGKTWIRPPGFKGKRFFLAVEADNEHDARALIQDCFAATAPTKDFGEVMEATKSAHAWVLELPEEF